MVRPRNDERIDIERRAIEVATRLLIERGAEQVSLRDIAEEAGCRPPALYRYFPNKDAILLAVHDEGFRRLYTHKAAAVAAAGSDVFERLRRGGLAYVQFGLENPNLYELMFMERGPFNRMTELPDREDLAGRALNILTDSIIGCQKAGYLEGIDPLAAAFTFWSIVHGAVSLALRRRSPFHFSDPEQAVAQAVEVTMRMVAATSR